MADPHVPTVEQRPDDSIVVSVETDSFKPNQEVEISVYLTQGDAYASHNEKKRIPLRDLNNPKQPAQIHVELPRTLLKAEGDLTVVTRVSEAWSTVLKQDSAIVEEYKKLGEGPKAVWTYQEEQAAGKEPGDSGSP
jgi:hypothetical protein